MRHVALTLITDNSSLHEILIAELAEAGYDSFEEEGKHLVAYCAEDAFDEANVCDIATQYSIEYSIQYIEEQNWNAVWEQDFKPVIVEDFCAIRADFHEIPVNVAHDIIITPKMSFGTGHHATTRLMIKQMKDMDINNRSVLDFGTGTGVLAILAARLGATSITAIDNDEWSYENTIENIGRNDVNNIKVAKGSLDIVAQEHYDIILANINRHILLEYMQDMYDLLNDNGVIVMSGILAEDKSVVLKKACDAGFKGDKTTAEDNWISIMLIK